MSRIFTVPIALGAAALVLVAAGCGCGGGGGTSASSTRTPTAPTGTAGIAQRAKGGRSAAQSNSTADSPASQAGSKRAAAGVPVYKGGDNSIQLWGVEASVAERAQVIATVRAFLGARAAAEWSKACSYLAAKQLRQFAGYVRGSGSANSACAKAMKGFAQGVPPSAFVDEARIERVLSLRLGKGYAFLIYTRRRPRGAFFATGLQRQGDTWKVVSVGPTRLGS